MDVEGAALPTLMMATAQNTYAEANRLRCSSRKNVVVVVVVVASFLDALVPTLLLLQGCEPEGRWRRDR